jgi:hypothetical protein
MIVEEKLELGSETDSVLKWQKPQVTYYNNNFIILLVTIHKKVTLF